MHGMAAAFLQTPELAIDGEEAKLLADAIAEVGKHYNIAPDPVTQAWLNLSMVVGAVYGPRVLVMWHKTKMPKPAPSPATAAMEQSELMPTNVSLFNPGNA